MEITILGQAANSADLARKEIADYVAAGATRMLFLLTPIPPGQTR